MSKLKIALQEKKGELHGHVDLPPDGTFVFEALKLVFEEFCRTNGYERETVHADFYRFCVFGERP